MTRRIVPEDTIRRHLVTARKYKQIHGWDPQQNRAAIARQFQVLRGFMTRHGIELYVVNLPELSWNRELYDPDKYTAYLRIMHEELGAHAFLDLRTALADDEFYDWSHPTSRGGRYVSKRVASFIQEQRAVRRDARHW